MSKHYFVSDLHLFCKRSDGHRHLDSLTALANDARTVVLGGDLFDFPWTVRASIDQTIDDAIDWLTKLAQSSPNCQFYYILGNHDSNLQFIDRLAKLSQEQTNLSWQPFHLRLKNSLFLHGDVADGHANPRKLSHSRTRWHQARKRGPILNRLYDLILLTNLHKTACSILYPNQRVARRILAYLESIDAGPGTGVKHVYYGHTHIALTNYVFDGVTFHNGGAPFRGLDFQFLEMDFSNDPA